MPRNLSGGSNHRSRKNHAVAPVRKLEDISKSAEDGQIYGQVTAELGDRRFKVRCKRPSDDEYIELVCKLRGSIPRGKRVTKERYVLINLPEYNDATGYIVEVYDESEVRQMRRKGLWDYEQKETVTHEFVEGGTDIAEDCVVDGIKIEESHEPFVSVETTLEEQIDIQNI